MDFKAIPVKVFAAGTDQPSGELYCEYLTDSVTVLSDGTITCGFDDPFRRRKFGNVATASVADVFHGEGMRGLRRRLLEGAACIGCNLHAKVHDRGGLPLPRVAPMPTRLILEPTIRCNLRCRNHVCDLNNDRAFEQRDEPFLRWDLYRKLMDELGPHLHTLYFFNYGEPFLHPRAADMLAYAKQVNPSLCIVTSTNGIPLAKGEVARRIVEEGLLRWVNFTIAGTDDETYRKYHKAGSFQAALAGMRRIVAEKRRLGRRYPEVYWRYLLFHWNDSDAQIATARRIAADEGVDQLRFFLCTSPMDGRSRLRAPGTPGYEAIRDALDHEFHYRADPWADQGLHAPEHDERLGAYAWTSRVATLPFPPGARPVLRLARNAAVAGAGAAVTIRTPWETRPGEVGVGAWSDNRLLPPPEGSGAYEVQIETVHTFLPFREGVSDDERELGAMLSPDCRDAPGASDAARLLARIRLRSFPPVAPRPQRALVRRVGNFGRAMISACMPPGMREQVFVRQAYKLLHARVPGRAEREAAVRRLRNGTSTAEWLAELLAAEGLAPAQTLLLFLACFRRPPGAAEFAAWVEASCSEASLEACAAAMVAAGEFRMWYRDADDAVVAARAWAELVGHGVEPPVWRGLPSRMAAIAGHGIFRARERHRAFACLAYLRLFGRAPDTQGLAYWVTAMQGGRPPAALVESALGSPEAAPFLRRVGLAT